VTIRADTKNARKIKTADGDISFMDTDGSLPLIIILTVLFGAFFSAAETAVTEFPNAKIKAFENEKGSKHLLWKLTKKPTRLMTEFTLIRFITLIVLAAAFVGGNFFPVLRVENSAPYWLFAAQKVLLVIAAIFTQMLFIEALPKRAARSVSSEGFALAAVPIICFMRIILSPFVGILYGFIYIFSKIFGLPGQNTTEAVTEEGILMMVDAGNETGIIEESQAEMISNIFDFSDTPVSDVMTHRTDVTAVSSKSNCVEIIEKAVSSGFSRIPVYSENIDHIIGVLCVKDLLTLIGNEKPPEDVFASRFIRDTIYLPETARCKNAFKQMTDRKMQMAVIMDEYGGTSGIVTVEDILETIVGSIQDEYDDEAEEITRISDMVYSVDGLASPEVILPKLGISAEDEEEYDTMSAFLIGLSGKLPEIGQKIEATKDNVKFTAMSSKDMRITRIKAEKITEEQI
jgi:putative hemolysin